MQNCTISYKDKLRSNPNMKSIKNYFTDSLLKTKQLNYFDIHKEATLFMHRISFEMHSKLMTGKVKSKKYNLSAL